MRRRIIDGREKNCGNFENRCPTDPSLNSKPSACDHRPHQRGNVRTIYSKRCATENRKGNSVFRSRVRIQHHRHQDDCIAKKDSQDRLPPIHSAFNERRCQHVCRHARSHRNPKRSHAPHAPLAIRLRNWRKINAIQMRIFNSSLYIEWMLCHHGSVCIGRSAPMNAKSATRLKMAWFALEKLTSADFSDEYSTADRELSTHCDFRRASLDGPTLKCAVIHIHRVGGG